MGTISQAKAVYALFATGAHTKTQVSNDSQIGVSSTTVNLTTAAKAYCVSATLATAADDLTIDLTTGIATIGTTPVAQVETATAAGTITLTGNATVTVTSVRIATSPVAVSVAVLDTDTASQWATKVRAALNLVTAITSVFTVGGATTAISLTEIVKTNNDATLNIALANGTCTGITAAPTSTNTTAGVGGVKLVNSTGDGLDFEGVSLGTMTHLHAILVKNTGATGIVRVDRGTDLIHPVLPNSAVLTFFDGGSSDMMGDLVISSPGVNTTSISVEVTICAL